MAGPPVGIVSDTHDNEAAVAEAVRLLAARGVREVIHCGDVCSASTIELFRGFSFRVCLGNNDSARELSAAAERIGGAYAARLDVEIGGKRFFVSHGDEERPLRGALESGRYDYVLYGHTHRQDDRRFGRTRLVNPGALYRAPLWTFALLDLGEDGLETVEVSRG
ncbi:MAG: YfcE family phosphodiesterase [Planctomycetia bacterium]|nr:YfcE family phosphodiesterase [Planctomycetia bacterium]